MDLKHNLDMREAELAHRQRLLDEQQAQFRVCFLVALHVSAASLVRLCQ